MGADGRARAAGGSTRYVCIASDATGATAERVVRATLEQFEGVPVELDVVPRVISVDQIRELVAQTRRKGGILAYTLVETRLRSEIAALANEAGVTTIDLMGPALHVLSQFLSTAPSQRPGFRYDRADPEHFRRLEAVSFTVHHDDGQKMDDLAKADLVVVGPSRTSKTPLSVDLAHTRGLRVANVPLALGVDPPVALKELPPRRAVGFTMNPTILCSIRRERMRGMGVADIAYADRAHVERELKLCHEFYRREPAWPIIDVTHRSIEEIALAVCAATVDAPRPAAP